MIQLNDILWKFSFLKVNCFLARESFVMLYSRTYSDFPSCCFDLFENTKRCIKFYLLSLCGQVKRSEYAIPTRMFSSNTNQRTAIFITVVDIKPKRSV